MNVITRFEGEAVVIGDSLKVTVLEVDGENVVLQIDGPEGTEIQKVSARESLLAGSVAE